MWYKTDDSGKIIAWADRKNEGYEYTEEDIVTTFDNRFVFKSETETDEYKKAEAEYNTNKIAERVIPTIEASVIAFVKKYFEANVATLNLSVDEKLLISGLAKPWQPGVHKKGELNNVGAMTWEVTQNYDNSVYPDINPDEPQTWANFNRPLHGTTPETARPFYKPTGTTDMYLVGEYAMFDSVIAKAKRNTVYSLSEYPVDWEVISQ